MEPVLVSREGGVVTVSLNRPDKKNAATWETWRQLAVAAREVAMNPSDRVLVITGEGGDFCSGALWSLRGTPEGGADDVRRERAQVQQLTHIGMDAEGEPVLTSGAGAVYRAVPRS